MTTVAAYVRVSTEAQAEKDSPELQRVAIRAWLAQHPEYDAVEWYEDPGVSGGTALASRPQGARLLADAKAGRVQAVAVYRYDRMHRDAEDALAVRKRLDALGVRLFSTTEGEQVDEFIAGILALLAQKERKTTGERSRAESRTVAKDGRWMGGITPHGYRVRHDGGARGAGWLEPDEATATVVRGIFAAAAEGLSCVRIAEDLNARGVPTRYAELDRPFAAKGKRHRKVAGKWGPGAVRRIIVNPTYKGTHVYGRRDPGHEKRLRDTPETTGKRVPQLIVRSVPALVDTLTWGAAQATLKRNFLFNPRSATCREYLLRGLLKCERCGRTFVGASSDEDKGGPRYVCGGKFRASAVSGQLCTAAAIDWDVEAQVWGDIAGLFTQGDVVEHALARHLHGAEAAAAKAKKEAAAAAKRLAALDEEDDRLVTLHVKGRLDEASLERQRARIAKERAAAAALVSAPVTPAAVADARKFVAWVQAEIAREDLTYAVKRRVVEALVKGGAVRTVAETVAVKKRARTRVKNAFAVVEIAYNLGLTSEYFQGATRLSSAWPKASDYVRQPGEEPRIGLADLEVTPEGGAVEAAIESLTDVRTNRDSWLPRA